jgi:lysophospholipase L1-like esterase
MATDAASHSASCSFVVEVQSTAPPPPPPPPLMLTCPADIAAFSTTGSPVPVSYQAPAVGGGLPPVAVTCSPPSGSAFSVGATNVRCAASDAALQTAECGFRVAVSVPPHLSATKFLAFGDSFTEGVVSVGPLMLLHSLATPQAYPGKLHALLEARYTIQDFTMANHGIGGERAEQGVERLPGVLDATRPEVLLLMEGANDLARSTQNGIQRAITALETMVKEAQRRGVIVFLATLPPERPARRPRTAPLVPQLNAEIAKLAAAQGAILVDVYAAFKGDADPYIGNDGLHPTEAGYQFMAEVFFASIVNELEIGSDLGDELTLLESSR